KLGEGRFQYDCARPRFHRDMAGDPGSHRIAVENDAIRCEVIVHQLADERRRVAVEIVLAGTRGIAAIAAIAGEEQPVALFCEFEEMTGLADDVAAPSGKIDEDRPAGLRRTVPGAQPQPVMRVEIEGLELES